MTVNKDKINISIPEALLAAAALLYLIGIRGWFPVCEVTDTVMACHWAGETLKGISILYFILTLIHIVMPSEQMKLGMDAALIGLSLLTVFIPGHIINICGMPGMACRRTTSPWTVAFSVIWILLILADILVCCNQISKKKHQRHNG